MYVEGGGPYASSETAANCRQGFRAFFKKALGNAGQPKIVASGSRDEAYKDFRDSLKNDPRTFAILLVDSEDPVSKGKTAADHLRDREKHWGLIASEQAHLMVQCMESWFLADKNTLADYYQQGFKKGALSPNPKIEKVPKASVMKGLRSATRNTKTKGEYHKGIHSFEILGLIDAEKVISASPFAARLVAVLRDKLAE